MAANVITHAQADTIRDIILTEDALNNRSNPVITAPNPNLDSFAHPIAKIYYHDTNWTMTNFCWAFGAAITAHVWYFYVLPRLLRRVTFFDFILTWIMIVEIVCHLVFGWWDFAPKGYRPALGGPISPVPVVSAALMNVRPASTAVAQLWRLKSIFRGKWAYTVITILALFGCFESLGIVVTDIAVQMFEAHKLLPTVYLRTWQKWAIVNINIWYFIGFSADIAFLYIVIRSRRHFQGKQKMEVYRQQISTLLTFLVMDQFTLLLQVAVDVSLIIFTIDNTTSVVPTEREIIAQMMFRYFSCALALAQAFSYFVTAEINDCVARAFEQERRVGSVPVLGSSYRTGATSSTRTGSSGPLQSGNSRNARKGRGILGEDYVEEPGPLSLPMTEGMTEALIIANRKAEPDEVQKKEEELKQYPWA